MISSDQPEVSDRRYWASIAVSSVLQMVAVLSLIGASVLVSEGSNREAAVASAVGLAMMPMVFGVAAIGTGRIDPGLSTLKALALFVLLVLTGGLITPAVGVAAGVAAGAVMVIDERLDRVMKARWIGVSVFVLYVFGLMLIAPDAGVFAVAVLPVLSVAITDVVVAAWRNRSSA